ncbi:maleylpyruvate isomerase family mycothiol-dependent enzyme [Symbioplanes lichenis]|uniref:maleylpyruvate isomerase family mycothiol-dependent enzyme n=1 Tax=Symbioplanes lichenis TaxID=1629072 RepID=UPI0027393BA9|nr:maleylpyruvate isomerase family mycothiol-dependent enzyme [Actinoplanes lichenis]
MNLDFSELVSLIDERAAVFRAVVAAAPDLGVQVPSCPEWTLFDLVVHLGEGRRRWAATVAAGPADGPAPVDLPAAPREREALLTWFDESVRRLRDALRAAGPDRECWTWWSGSPRTAGGVARHQLQQMAVHTYDAQLAVGDPQPLPAAAARDGVEEFLLTCVTTPIAWPHEPATVDYRTGDGGAWRLELSGAGARVTSPGDTPATVAAQGTPNELVLWFYGRIPLDALQFTGDRRVLEQLVAWEPA